MTSQDPSEVRCPNCGRLTPFAPFCTHCGAVVQEGAAGARPHAMDRVELERRIRERRQAGPFHRGAEESPGEHRPSLGRMGAFVPEPTDDLARHEQPVADEQPRVDYFDERAARKADEAPSWGSAADAQAPTGAGGIPGAAVPPSRVDWPSRDLTEDESSERESSNDDAVVGGPMPGASPMASAAAAGLAAAGLASAGAAAGHEAAPAATPPGASAGEAPVPTPERSPGPSVAERAYESPAPAAYEPAYRPPEPRDAPPPYGPGGGGYDDDDDADWSGYDEEPPRRGSGLAIIGFLILGAAALLGGAFLFAAINGPKPAADLTSPSPTATATGGETASPTGTGTASAGASGSASPAASDNFSAKVEPCASNQMGFSGCAANGTHLGGDQVWVWVGFKNGQASTVIGVTIVSQATKSPVADGSLELDRLVGCDPGKPCSGYMQMSFGNLNPGDYQIQVTRDGNPAASSTFTVGS